jgi:3-phytase
VIYRRNGHNQFVKKFRIVDGKATDGVSETDGIDVTTANLGSAFPNGVFITQDGHNDGNQNFKLVPLQSIIRNREARPSVVKRTRQTVIRQAWKPAG